MSERLTCRAELPVIGICAGTKPHLKGWPAVARGGKSAVTLSTGSAKSAAGSGSRVTTVSAVSAGGAAAAADCLRAATGSGAASDVPTAAAAPGCWLCTLLTVRS
jgi:hypothetical protein